jgi:O-antigen/teichoic acid export membrane protein
VIHSHANSSRALVVSKILASAASFIWLAILAKYLPSDSLGTVFKCLFISQSLVFITDQGLTQTLVRQQSSGLSLDDDISRINQCVRIRFKRAIVLLPVLIVLLQFLTEASTYAMFAVAISHVATLIYSTINAGLLGSNLRYIETISEPSSRLFILCFGTLTLFLFDQLRNAQFVIFAYAAADAFMLVSVLYFYLTISPSATKVSHVKFEVEQKFRVESTLAGGTLSTVGIGETWALSIRSSSSDFAFYGLITRFVDISGLVASYAGYSHIPILVKAIHESSLSQLIRRVRRIILLSFIPTAGLVCVILAARLGRISLQGYDVVASWFPLLILVLSTPAVVMSKYLMLTIGTLDPRGLMFFSFFSGLIATIGVLWVYELSGLSAIFIVLALVNFLRAFWLGLLTKGIHSRLKNTEVSM